MKRFVRMLVELSYKLVFKCAFSMSFFVIKEILYFVSIIMVSTFFVTKYTVAIHT